MSINSLCLNMAMAAIEFAEADQKVAHRILENGAKDGHKHQKIRVKYARRRLVKAQHQLDAALALMRDNDDES